MDDEEEVRGNNKFKARNVSFETYFSPFIYAALFTQQKLLLMMIYLSFR